MKATVRLKTVKRPISEEIIDFRLQAAIPNTSGYKGMTSYKRPYFIAESSDYSEDHIEGHFAKILGDFEKQMHWLGFTDLQFNAK